MQKRAIIMLLLALVMGIFAVSLVNTAIKNKSTQGESVNAPPVVPVVVASANLDIGTRLNEVMLKVVDWPKESAPDGTFSDIPSLIGEKPPVVLKEIHKGEAVLPYKLSGPGGRAGLTPRIAPEMRAMTIAVNEVRGVAGFVLPGDRVDVLYTAKRSSNSDTFVTKTILQNMLVLAVDQSTSEKSDKPQVVNAVTLQVNPHQGKILALSQHTGELTLLLRNAEDMSTADDGSISIKDLGTAKKAAPVASKAQRSTSTTKVTRPTAYNIKVTRGLNTTTYSTHLAKPEASNPVAPAKAE